MKLIPLTLAALLAFAPMAMAAEDMVLIPRSVAEMALSWIGQPDAGIAVRLYGTMAACIADNPKNGVTTHNGKDGCPAVTEALAERAKELADVKPAAPAVSH